eukprot:COSAG03_NODE_6632_length_1027_cov_2.562500_2_plen_226_part_00
MKKYKSYAVTLSTVEDIENELQARIVKWLKKQDYAYGVIEHDKQGVRHAHFQVWYDEQGREKGTITKPLKKIIEQYAPLSKPHIAIKVKIAYNDDWLTEYLQKSIIESLIDNVPTGTDQYYPSLEEQEKVKNQSNAVDQRFHRYAVDFNEWNDKPEEAGINKSDVARFMCDMMFKSKKYPVIIDKKNRVNITTSLYLTTHTVASKEFLYLFHGTIRVGREIRQFV